MRSIAAQSEVFVAKKKGEGHSDKYENDRKAVGGEVFIE